MYKYKKLSLYLGIFLIFFTLSTSVTYATEGVAAESPAESAASESPESQAEGASGNPTGVVHVRELNLRVGPGTSYHILECLRTGDKLEILEQDGDWCRVTAASGNTGWVYGAYVSLDQDISRPPATRSGVVSSQKLNLRTGPGTSYKILECLRYSNRVVFLEQDGDWCRVTAASGNTGWVYGHYLTLDSVNSRSGIRTSEIVDYAKSFLDVKYVWGGSSPTGFDCSGFVKYVFSKFRIALYRTSSDQATQGIWVSKADLRQGDLVFFDTDGGHNDITHAGISIGNGMFIHSSTSRGKVVISTLADGVYSDIFITSRRMTD